MNSWTRRTIWLGALGAMGLLVPQPWNPSTRAQSAAQRAHGIENFDLRVSKGGPGREEHVRERHDRGAKRRDGIAQRGRARAIGRQQLAERLPGVQIQDAAELGTAEIVRVPRGRASASASLRSLTHESRPQAVKRFLSENADLFGLTPQQVAGLEEKGDYANPDGGLAFVELEQKANGRSVFRGTLRAAFDANGELFQTVGQLAPDLDEASLTGKPTLDAAAAAQAAAAAVGLEVAAGEFLAVKDDGDNVVLDGPFVRETSAELVYFPLEPGVAALAWSIVLWEKDVAWYVIVDAEDGELLFRKNITNEQTAPATYVVYNDDSPSPLSPTTDIVPGDGPGIQPPAIARTSFTLISEHAANNLGWITDGGNTTTGNNVDAGLDLVSPNGIDLGSRPIGSPIRVFDFAYNPGPGNPAPEDSPTDAKYRAGEVVNMFFWSNRYHDRLYELGFTEAARNFQQDNFGRGGLGNDRVLAEGQDFESTNNANFDTPPDGIPGRMQMGIFTGPTPDRTSGLDQDIVIHELTHGTSNRLHANASGLTAVMSRGMGEGWSDFFARSLLSGPDEDPNGVYAIGGYSTLQSVLGFTDNYFYGIRRFPYAVRSTVGPNGKPYNPLTFADIDGAQIDLTDGAYPRGPLGSSTAFQVHNIGEVWCMSLLEVRARIITRMGWKAGNQRMLQLVTDGMKLDPANPTLIDGRDSILAASAASDGGPEEERDIWTGFATRGLGFSASALSPESPTVVEAFDLPSLQLGPVTIADDSFDHSGYADPGETVLLNVPLVNPWLSTTAAGTTAEITGATPALVSYGDIAGGATVSRQFTFTVPLSTPCGSLLALTVDVDSSLGPISHTFNLTIGAPTGTIPFVEYSSGGIAVPIPEVGTTEVPIDVPDTGIVADVAVGLRLNHPFDSDLTISLVAPDGTTVPLSINRGGAGDNFGSGPNDCSGTFTVFDDAAGTAIGAGSAPFAGSFRPDAPLAGFRGKSMAGTWKLRVTDGFLVDSGTLGCVQLRIRKQLFFCVGVAGTPSIVAAPPELIAESAEPANLAPDPDETVTMNLVLRNVGTGLTGNLVATLMPGGGVNAPSGPQSYGVVSPVGDAVTRAFTFVASGNCGESITATFHLQDGALDLGNVSFTLQLGTTVVTQAPPVSNLDGVIIQDRPRIGAIAPASPYPSTLEVSGLSGTVSKVTVRLDHLSHTFPGDIDILLVGPGGQRMILMSDAGGGTDIVDVDVSFDDAAPTVLPATLVSGTFRPTNLGTVDVFPAPAPAAPYAATLSIFNGTDPNGAWSLYVVDDSGIDAGSIAGWTITITTTAPVCVTSPCLLRVPDDLARSNDAGQCGALVPFAPTGVSGSCGVVTTSPASGSFFLVGATVVTSTGTHQDGSTTTATFDVAVSDVEGPVLAQPVASPSSLWPPNHKLRPVQVSWSATDNCTAAGSIVGALSASSNEPVNGLGDGDTAPDWIVDGLHAVRLRAERSGRGSGRTYTVALTVTDQYGNATTKTVPVLVPHDQAR